MSMASKLVAVEVTDARGYKTTYRVRPDQVDEYRRRDRGGSKARAPRTEAPEPEPAPEVEVEPEEEPAAEEPKPKARRPRARKGDVDTK
jgi:hypothetical protein